MLIDWLLTKFRRLTVKPQKSAQPPAPEPQPPPPPSVNPVIHGFCSVQLAIAKARSFERLSKYFELMEIEDFANWEDLDCLVQLAEPYDRVVMMVFVEKYMKPYARLMSWRSARRESSTLCE